MVLCDLKNDCYGVGVFRAEGFGTFPTVGSGLSATGEQET
jgi:hypothetical protein